MSQQIPLSATKLLAISMINRSVLIHLIKEAGLDAKVKENLENVAAKAFVIGEKDGAVELAVPELNRYVEEAAKTFILQLGIHSDQE